MSARLHADQVSARFPSGVIVVTAARDGQPYGMLASGSATASTSPPLLLVSVRAGTAIHDELFIADALGVNLLARGQEHIARAFGEQDRPPFGSVKWRQGALGSPIFADVAASLEIEVSNRLAAYTHTIIVGRVASAESSSLPPLVVVDGTFMATVAGIG